MRPSAHALPTRALRHHSVDDSFVRDQTGAVFAEYVVVFLLATLTIAISVATVGLPLLALYLHAQTLIGLPIP